jgi:hypothetical protein
MPARIERFVLKLSARMRPPAQRRRTAMPGLPLNQVGASAPPQPSTSTPPSILQTQSDPTFPAAAETRCLPLPRVTTLPALPDSLSIHPSVILPSSPPALFLLSRRPFLCVSLSPPLNVAVRRIGQTAASPASQLPLPTLQQPVVPLTTCKTVIGRTGSQAGVGCKGAAVLQPPPKVAPPTRHAPIRLPWSTATGSLHAAFLPEYPQNAHRPAPSPAPYHPPVLPHTQTLYFSITAFRGALSDHHLTALCSALHSVRRRSRTPFHDLPDCSQDLLKSNLLLVT